MRCEHVELEGRIFENDCFRVDCAFESYFRNYPISFAKTQENISQILLKSEEKRKVAANLLCWKCKAENMENCYEKGEIEICDGRLVRIWKHRLPE